MIGPFRNPRPLRRGFTLLEMVTYIAVLAIVATVAWVAYCACVSHSLGVLSNVDDITRTLKAGERWREDLRKATTPPTLVEGAVHIPQADGEVVYQLSGETVLRKAGQGATPQPFLTRVKASRMQLDPGKHVASWRWEVELLSRERAQLRPLFTFRAVPMLVAAR